MEASKAEEIATSPDELQDLQDDLVVHQQTEPGYCDDDGKEWRIVFEWTEKHLKI